MSKPRSDELTKPDMQAILARTHLSVELDNFLLPVFEAVSNAIHGIEERYGSNLMGQGRISIAFENTNDPESILITVSDNGIGLNDSNYGHFKTPFSGHKLKQHGRGFGRFIAFKIFNRVEYSSKFLDLFDMPADRAFRFDITKSREIRMSNLLAGEIGVMVAFSEPLDAWKQLIANMKAEDIADALGAHFLPHFLYGALPHITISFDGGAPKDLTTHFKQLFVESDSGFIQCDIDGVSEQLSYSLARVPKTRMFKSHCLLFAAADRIIGGARDLTNKLISSTRMENAILCSAWLEVRLSKLG